MSIIIFNKCFFTIPFLAFWSAKKFFFRNSHLWKSGRLKVRKRNRRQFSFSGFLKQMPLRIFFNKNLTLCYRRFYLTTYLRNAFLFSRLLNVIVLSPFPNLIAPILCPYPLSKNVLYPPSPSISATLGPYLPLPTHITHSQLHPHHIILRDSKHLLKISSTGLESSIRPSKSNPSHKHFWNLKITKSLTKNVIAVAVFISIKLKKFRPNKPRLWTKKNFIE